MKKTFTLGDLWLGFLIGFIAGATLVSALVLAAGGGIP